MKKLFKRSVWTLLTIFFAFILIIAVVAGAVAQQYASWIDTFFGVNRYELVSNDSDGDPEETQYYVSDYAQKGEDGKLVLTKDEQGVYHQTYDNEAMRAHSIDVAERVGEEGSVLLWNINNALPLSQGDKVTTFGVQSNGNAFLTGIGSGNISVNRERTYADVLTEHGLAVNQDIFTLFKYASVQGYVGGYFREYDLNTWYQTGVHDYFVVSEAPWSVLDSTPKGSVEKNVGQYGDAALYLVSRYGGETGDTAVSSSESEDHCYMSFTDAERSVIQGLKALKAKGVIKKIVLILNSAAAMNLKYVKDDISAEGIDACLWVGYGGSTMYDYIADLLLGNANPSGGLTDTWVYDLQSAPANSNFGRYTFAQSTGLPISFENNNHNFNDAYVIYQEGIYVGYRYYETRYEDYVLGRGGADSVKGSTTGNAWKYSDEVAYPFGSGQSYTSFSYGKMSVKRDGSDYVVSVPVTNTGSVAGKEVVQIYLQKPYTQYDKDNKVEKSAVDLVGFDKTSLLEPGKSETVEITVPEYEFKSYDSYGKKTYILEAGDYYLTAARNSHDAINNILAAKGVTAEQKARMDGEGNTDLVYLAGYSRDIDGYSVSPFTNVAVTNLFDDVDVNLYAGTQDQKITYLTRNDWNGTYPETNVVLICTDPQMVKDMQYAGEVPTNPDATMPLYDTVTSEYGKLTLIQLKGVPYDDPLWEDLLNEMTFEEQVEIMRDGAHNIAGAPSIAAPGFKATDGPCGLGAQAGIAKGLNSSMAFPCNPIVASTFNIELIEELGEAFGQEILHVNFSGIYGVGANIHRSAFGGRNWEYYSEDGFLSGMCFNAENSGLMSRGIVLFSKHFVLNDQESAREGVATFANEQSIREIYLKSFERAVTVGHTNGVMTSYNRIGCTWTGRHKGLLTDLLRGEWGFEGLTETDASSLQHMSGTVEVIATGLVAGQDVWMGSVGENALDSYKNNATVMQALRQAVHRVLYVQVNSAAMNGMSSSTDVVYVTPAWEKMVLALEIVSGIITGLCAAMVAASWIIWSKDKKKGE